MCYIIYYEVLNFDMLKFWFKVFVCVCLMIYVDKNYILVISYLCYVVVIWNIYVLENN